jgi:hypothetical protein
METIDDDSLLHISYFLRPEDGLMFRPVDTRTWHVYKKLLPMKPTLTSFARGDEVHCRSMMYGIVEGRTKHFLRIRDMTGSVFRRKPHLVCRYMRFPDPMYVPRKLRCAWCQAMWKFYP